MVFEKTPSIEELVKSERSKAMHAFRTKGLPFSVMEILLFVMLTKSS
jgi:hypothetical protein